MKGMDHLRNLEFWATISGIIIFLAFAGSIFFGLFPFNSALFVSAIVFLIALAWAYGKKNKILIIFSLIIVLIIYLNLGNLNSIFAGVKISSITNISNQSNFNPECEKIIFDKIGDNRSVYFILSYDAFRNFKGLEPVVLSEHNYGPNNMDITTEYWRIFGEPKVSSTIRWGDKVGENSNWLYGGAIWEYPLIVQQITNVNGVILGNNEIKFKIQIKNLEDYIKNGIATSRSVIGYGNQVSLIDKIITIPLREVLQITQCKIIN